MTMRGRPEKTIDRLRRGSGGPKGVLAAVFSREGIFTGAVTIAGYAVLASVVLIFYFIISRTLPLFEYQSLWSFLTETRWLSVSTPPVFGIVPHLVGSLWIVGWALLLGVPVGLGVAVYIAEMASPGVRVLARTLLGTLAGIPSVVYGILGLLVLGPRVANLFSLPTGLTGFTAGTVLALMIVPTVATLAEESILAVPGEYREAALALGATPFTAFWSVVWPAASSGLTASVLLASGRALGETMTVLMVGGGRLAVPQSLFVPMRTMTATLAAEINNASQYGVQYNALFGLGAVLFVITLFITTVTDILLHRARRGRGSL